MNNYKTPLLLLIISILLVHIPLSCERKSLEERPIIHSTALIPVTIDWSSSGISPDGASQSMGNQDYVHKVSFRLFPKDGSEPFEDYLEGQSKTDNGGSIYGGHIEVPAGSYSLLVMNETVTEQDLYWADYYRFHNILDFLTITARTLTQSPDFSKPPYDFYTPHLSTDEKFHIPAHKLASWSLVDFIVTDEMVTRTRTAQTRAEVDDLALDVKMQPLHRDIHLVVDVENIASLWTIHGVLTGLTTTKNLTTHAAGSEFSTILFEFNRASKVHASKTTTATKEHTIRCFGRHISSSDDMTYKLHLDVITVDGKRYTGQNLIFDITDDLKKGDSEIVITITLPPLTLPVVDGKPQVGDWGDDEDIPIG